MKPRNLKSYLGSLFVAGLLISLPFLCPDAQGQRGGGGRGGGGGARGGGGGGGLSGGSFRGGGAVAQGPRGGAAARGPGGGAAVRGPGGGAAARGPGGQTAYRPGTTPSGGGTYNRNVNVNQNWNAYSGPGYRPYAGAAVAGLTVGATVAALSAAAQPVVVNNQTYYSDGGTYYQKCYEGTEVSYCVVPDPNQ